LVHYNKLRRLLQVVSVIYFFVFFEKKLEKPVEFGYTILQIFSAMRKDVVFGGCQRDAGGCKAFFPENDSTFQAARDEWGDGIPYRTCNERSLFPARSGGNMGGNTESIRPIRFCIGQSAVFICRLPYTKEFI